MANYTFITLFRGGTYVRQIKAAQINDAARCWADQLARNPEIEGFDGSKFMAVFQTEFEEFPPAAIDGCPNVWSLFYLLGKHALEVNIVKTSPEFEKPEKSGMPHAALAVA